MKKEMRGVAAAFVVAAALSVSVAANAGTVLGGASIGVAEIGSDFMPQLFDAAQNRCSRRSIHFPSPALCR